MPTYEYRCRECGASLDVVQSFTDDPLTECPACEGELKKVFAAPSIAFKGDGFYKNDSRGGSSKSKTAVSGKDADSGSSGSDSSDSSDSSSKDASKDSPSKSDGKSSPSDKSSGSSDSKGSSSKKDTKASSSSSSS